MSSKFVTRRFLGSLDTTIATEVVFKIPGGQGNRYLEFSGKTLYNRYKVFEELTTNIAIALGTRCEISSLSNLNRLYKEFPESSKAFNFFNEYYFNFCYISNILKPGNSPVEYIYTFWNNKLYNRERCIDFCNRSK